MAVEESVKYVSIIGSTGYVGAELVRGFAGHPFFRFRHLTSQTFAGKPYSEIYPEFRGIVDVVCEDLPYEEVAKDLGTMQGENATLTVRGNNFAVHGNNYGGVTINDDDTLILDNV